MAKTICTLLGIVFIIVGIVGFFSHDLLGAHLTTAHNIVHIVSGLLALYFGLAGSLGAARAFALIFGVVYLLLGVVGFIMGDPNNDRMLTIINSDSLQLMLGTRDHIIHIALGVIFLLGALATRTNGARPVD
jgi:hypothetical protein